MSANLPQPGWYEDPAEAGRLRYWDGAAWTTDVRPAPASAPVAPAAPAAAPVADDPAPFVPLDFGHVTGGHGGGSSAPAPDPDPFVPLDLGHVVGGHGGATPETQPDPAPVAARSAAPATDALPGPTATDALPGPDADPVCGADAPPGRLGALTGRLADLRDGERPNWAVLSAGAAAIAALVATAALTLGGGEGTAVDPDAAYAACQARVEEATEVEGLEFAPHGEVTVSQTDAGMTLDFWARRSDGPERRRQPVDVRCAVATADGEPSVTGVLVPLGQATTLR